MKSELISALRDIAGSADDPAAVFVSVFSNRMVKGDGEELRFSRAVLSLIDAIEEEISGGYLELPTYTDGTHIAKGDKLKEGVVDFCSVYSDGSWFIYDEEGNEIAHGDVYEHPERKIEAYDVFGSEINVGDLAWILDRDTTFRVVDILPPAPSDVPYVKLRSPNDDEIFLSSSHVSVHEPYNFDKLIDDLRSAYDEESVGDIPNIIKAAEWMKSMASKKIGPFS